jgi:hypothetical protein
MPKKLVLVRLSCVLVLCCSLAIAGATEQATPGNISPQKLGIGAIAQVRYTPDGTSLVVASAMGVELRDATTTRLPVGYQGGRVGV